MFLSIALFLCLPAGTTAPSKTAVLRDNDPFRAAGPYCGVYSVYGCLKLFGKTTPIEKLLEPRYVGSDAGSSLTELMRAVEDCGLHARAMRGLTAESLRTASVPIILHVKDRRRGHEFDHWVLYLGMEAGKARILDPPAPLEVVPFAEVLARWDGTGLLVSDKPIETARFALSTWVGTLVNLSILIAFSTGIVGWLTTRVPGGTHTKPASTFHRLARQTIVVFGCSLFLALGYHSVSADGFLRNRAALASVKTRFYTENLREYSNEEMARVVKDRKTLVIDARFDRDYQYGHLPGAINVPVNSTLAFRMQVLGNVPKDQPIVLYCQSEGCHFDEELADFLHFNGYTNLTLYTGGYRAWAEYARTEK